jgi:hypothetical protein
MSDLKFFINAEELASIFGEAKKEAEQAITDGVAKLAAMTHAKVLQLANEDLHSTRKLYTDNLDFKQISDGVWVVTLDEPAMFIEEGRQSGSMVDDLLKNNSKVSKDGNRYKVIPFEHSKPQSQQTKFSQDLTSQIKRQLKSQNIPFKKLEYNADGSPRIGKLHTMDLPSAHPTEKASHPALHGLTIYQTKTASGNVRRDIMTFRVVSDKSKRENKWVHPGLEAKHYFEKAWEDCQRTWEDEILPEILKQYEK